MVADRLDLLRRLTTATPSWTLVKGASSALDGRGDIDCAVPAVQRPLIHDAVAAWAAATGRGPVLGCDHLPGALVLAVFEPGTPATLVQIDLLDHRLLHGSSILRAVDLLTSVTVEADGYRQLTPGAEAVARLVLDEWRPWAPRPPAASLAELQSLLEEDPAGAGTVASRLDRRLGSAVAAVAAGLWPRSTLVAAELASLARGIRRPGRLIDRLAVAPSRRSCPLLKALANERTVAGDPAEWIAAVRRVHPKLRL